LTCVGPLRLVHALFTTLQEQIGLRA
jgi:hypothetical protein